MRTNMDDDNVFVFSGSGEDVANDRDIPSPDLGDESASTMASGETNLMSPGIKAPKSPSKTGSGGKKKGWVSAEKSYFH